MAVLIAPNEPRTGYRFTVDQYKDMIDSGLFVDAEEVELRDGQVRLTNRRGGSTPYRFSLDQYHRMIAAGVLDEDDRVEFLHGEVVPKMPQGDPHAFGIEQLNRLLIRLVSDDVSVRCQCPVTIGEDEPEPDFVLCVRPEKRENRHPRAEHTFLIVEIADSSLEFDRTEKMGTYARAGIPVYWIVNLEDRLIEVYTDPAVADSRYGRRTGYGLGQDVPVIVAGVEVGRIEVSAVLR